MVNKSSQRVGIRFNGLMVFDLQMPNNRKDRIVTMVKALQNNEGNGEMTVMLPYEISIFPWNGDTEETIYLEENEQNLLGATAMGLMPYVK